MAIIRREIEEKFCEFEQFSRRIDVRQKELADQEARRSAMAADAAAKAGTIAIQQGRNIRLLTTVSIFFLPLTYVTSSFGMTNVPTGQSFWMFGTVPVAICVPFFMLVIPLNTREGLRFGSKLQRLPARGCGLVKDLVRVRQTRAAQ